MSEYLLWSNTTDLKIAARIEIKTLKKILNYSIRNGPQRKTNMATHCKMSYSRFIPYLNIMVIMNLLEIFEDDGYFVNVTELGRWVINQLENIDHSDQWLHRGVHAKWII